MAGDERQLLSRVFSDACVVDIDMSRWAEQVSIWAWSGHWRPWRDVQPLVEVTFAGVTDFLVRVPPAAADPATPRPWHIDDLKLKRVPGGRFKLALGLAKEAATIAVAFASVAVREVEDVDLGSCFPGWKGGDGRLERPGLSWFLARARRRKA